MRHRAVMQRLVWSILLGSAVLAGCAAPPPYRAPAPPPPAPSTPTQPEQPPEPQPGEPPSTVEQPPPPPAPVVREPTLGPASRALVSQAQTQLASGNYAVAAGSIERALRIEPNNPLLWLELGKIRQEEGNYSQAEGMGRKAASMSVNAPKTQAASWRLIAESYRARGRNSEAQEALARAEMLSSR